MDEHAWAGQGTADLSTAILAMKTPAFAVRFIPAGDDDKRAAQFDLWCRAVMAAGRCTALVEELAFVTRPSLAPPGWRSMCLLGRHDRHRVTIVATSQRPAQVDKDFLGNCDTIHAGRLASEPDARRVAQFLGVGHLELMQLPDLDWIERRAGDLAAKRGRLNF